MIEKEQRPSPRRGITWEANVGGQKIFLRSGEYADGRLCEIWVTVSKQGTLLQAMLDGFAIALSLALQHGVPLSQYIDAYRHTKFDPCGPVSGDPDIKWASSLFDYIIQRLELSYATVAKKEERTSTASTTMVNIARPSAENAVNVPEQHTRERYNEGYKQVQEVRRKRIDELKEELSMPEKVAGPPLGLREKG